MSKVAKNKVWWVDEQRDGSPSLPPSQPSRSSSFPCHHDSCTLNQYRQPHACTTIQAHTGMHTCTSEHACLNAQLLARVHMQAHVHTHACTTHTHTQTHINTHSLLPTHTHTPKQALYLRAHAHTNTYTNTRASVGQLHTGVKAGMAKMFLERVWGYPGLFLMFMNIGIRGE